MSAAAAYTAATSAAGAFILLLFATSSPWTMYALNLVSPTRSAWYGVGPFVAGAQQSSAFYSSTTDVYYYGGIVWWNQLNTQNTCAAAAPLRPWATSNGLCDANDNFVMPSESMAIQACIILATIFSFFACCSGFSVSKSKAGGGGSAACTSFLAMIFSIVAFSLWSTWSMSQKLQNGGDYVPVWSSLSSSTSNPSFFIGPSPTKVSLYYGWTYITTIVSFVLLLFSTVTFSLVAKRLSQEDSDPFGTGGMRAI